MPKFRKPYVKSTRISNPTENFETFVHEIEKLQVQAESLTTRKAIRKLFEDWISTLVERARAAKISGREVIELKKLANTNLENALKLHEEEEDTRKLQAPPPKAKTPPVVDLLTPPVKKTSPPSINLASESVTPNDKPKKPKAKQIVDQRREKNVKEDSPENDEFLDSESSTPSGKTLDDLLRVLASALQEKSLSKAEKIIADAETEAKSKLEGTQLQVFMNTRNQIFARRVEKRLEPREPIANKLSPMYEEHRSKTQHNDSQKTQKVDFDFDFGEFASPPKSDLGATPKPPENPVEAIVSSGEINWKPNDYEPDDFNSDDEVINSDDDDVPGTPQPPRRTQPAPVAPDCKEETEKAVLETISLYKMTVQQLKQAYQDRIKGRLTKSQIVKKILLD